MIKAAKSKIRLWLQQVIIRLIDWSLDKGYIIGYYSHFTPAEEVREMTESIAERLLLRIHNEQPTIVLRWTGDPDDPFDAFEVGPTS